MNSSLTIRCVPKSVELEQLARGDWFEYNGALFIATDRYPSRLDDDDAYEDCTDREVLRVDDGSIFSMDRGTRVYIVDVSITQEGYVIVE